jgi:hypothetical protein
MLRSPARFQATARRLVELYRQNADRADGTVRAAVTQAWLHAEAYTLNTYATATRLMAGGQIGAEASLNKIFWSELDLSMHAAAMSLLGARGTVAAGAGRAGRRRLAGRLDLRAERTHLRGHQRDTAQHHC